jgi:hypothetical protein
MAQLSWQSLCPLTFAQNVDKIFQGPLFAIPVMTSAGLLVQSVLAPVASPHHVDPAMALAWDFQKSGAQVAKALGRRIWGLAMSAKVRNYQPARIV